MRTTKLTLIKVAALALFVCVLATGCIGSAAAADNSADAKAVAGFWTIKTDNDSSEFVMALEGDGTGFVGVVSDAFADTCPKTYVPLTWKIGADGKLVIEYTGTGVLSSLSYDKASALLVDEDGVKYARFDPITGIWFGKSVSSENGKTLKSTYVFKNDGTGMVSQSYLTEGNNDIYTFSWMKYPFSWKKSGNKYNLSYVNGISEELTLNDLQDGFVSSQKKSTDGYKKMFLDKFVTPQILGVWVDEKNSALTIFGADGKGARVCKGDVSPLNWKMTDIGNYFVEFTDGNLKGYAGRYTYDLKTSTLTTTTGAVLSRPMSDFNGFTILALPKGMSIAEKRIGAWVTKGVVDGTRQYIVPI